MTLSSNRLRSTTWVRATLCISALCALPSTAHAYIDPGTGSLLFQSLLAVLFGIGVAFRKVREWLSRLWAFILRRPPADDANE